MIPFVHGTYRDAYHGPQPAPDWVISEDPAQQFERGILKTGKEAEVLLVERRRGERRDLLAAKRYRASERRRFRDDSRYRHARRTGNRRTDLAIDQGTRAGVVFGNSCATRVRTIGGVDSLTPEQCSLRARMAAYALRATHDPRDTTKPAGEAHQVALLTPGTEPRAGGNLGPLTTIQQVRGHMSRPCSSVDRAAAF